MKAIKRIIALILVSIFVIGAVFISYTGIKNGAVVYATVNDDSIYVPLRSESDVVKSFQAYCKSRDLTIEGSLTDAVTTFTTGAFNSACNELGIDITELQAEIKAEYDNSGEPVKFFFNDTGVMAMNRIFAQFLQDNELQVEDTDVNKPVYSGDIFVDDNGNKCNVFIVTSFNGLFLNNGTTDNKSEKIIYYGTPLKYSNSDLVDCYNNSVTPQITVNGSNVNIPIYRNNYSDGFSGLGSRYSNSSAYNCFYTYSDTGTYVKNIVANGYISVAKELNGNVYKVCIYNYCNFVVNNSNQQRYGWEIRTYNISPTSDNIVQNVTVNIVSNTINNNTYEGDTYITNEGDIINNNPDNPDQPDLPDYPEEPTGNVDDWGAEMPDLNIPWYLQGKEDKFPWNIPFNIMLTLSLLKAEPQAPHFEGTMDFKFTTYDYEIDLSQFDDVAEVLRKMEVIAFLIGLMVLTRNLIGW